jgi:hypothetical protein
MAAIAIARGRTWLAQLNGGKDGRKCPGMTSVQRERRGQMSGCHPIQLDISKYIVEFVILG